MASNYNCVLSMASNYSCAWPVQWPVASNYNCGWPVTSKYSCDWPVASQVIYLMIISQPPGLMCPNALITGPRPVSGPAKYHKMSQPGLINVS